MWGLMMQHVQLVKKAVVGISLPKNRSTSAVFFLGWVRTVHCITQAIGAISGSKGAGGIHFSLDWVSRSNDVSPLVNSTFSHNLHASANITLQEGTQFTEERLWLVLTVKSVRSLSIKAWHFKLADNKTVLVNWVNDLSCVSIDVGLDHSKGRLLFLSELLAREYITVVNNFKLARVNSHDWSDKEFFHVDVLVGHPLQKHPAVFQIVHIDSPVSGIVCEKVLSDEWGLCVKPLGLEDVAFLFYNCWHSMLSLSLQFKISSLTNQINY